MLSRVQERAVGWCLRRGHCTSRSAAAIRSAECSTRSMMEAVVLVKDAIAMVHEALKRRGFSAKGSTYYRSLPSGNTALISVQKSHKSSATEALVTLNYGIYSNLVGRKLGYEATPLDVAKAHWRQRPREDGREKWFSIHEVDSVGAAAAGLLAALEDVLSELEAVATNEALRDLWRSGSSPGLTRMQCLVFLAILLNELGPAEQLGLALDELRALVKDTIHARLIEGQLATAGVRRP